MRRIVWAELDAPGKKAALARPERRRSPEVVAAVQRIFDDVARDGAAAVDRWSLKLDGAPSQRLDLSRRVVAAARARLAGDDLDALETAVEQVRRYHEATRPQDETFHIGGVRCSRRWRAIPTCGLYVPGGSAPLFSTLIMLAEPARIAGVAARLAATPPSPQGPHPMMIAAAAACGLDALHLVGGAQAIAAMAFGAGLAKADKIFGPGNAYVAEAKRLAASLPSGPQIDAVAGPSELMVIADDLADPAALAADLLSQAEHDADAQVALVALSPDVADAVRRDLQAQLTSLPRAHVAAASLRHARLILARDAAEAAEIANLYAPEHLSLQTRDGIELSERIDNAGAVFVGHASAEVFGDYVSGPSHVLPTDGEARRSSGVGVASFMKSFVVQEIDSAAAGRLAGAAARLARLEGLEAHARAAERRIS
jgi:histidinol dehydrogenase